MTAARALRGSKGPGAVPALLSALGGQTRQRSSTSRDARLALLERVGELGTAEHAAALQPLLADFDPRVAAAAAAILERWAGLPSGPRDRLPSGYGGVAVEEVRRLDGATAVVRMKKGGSFTLALLAWEAPETAVGFARLAECGYYNGLTFHRVEPNFVVQGGSPGANEYAGYKSYMRDEVGLASNVRGTVGLSTRGRDTGDAQWYVNLADNARLDHNYTVFATVTSGMDVVDGVLEGDEIAEVRLVLPAGRRTK
jgi:cyclophilin family peptidyl-prolyl cis-trans isomerase